MNQRPTDILFDAAIALAAERARVEIDLVAAIIARPADGAAVANAAGLRIDDFEHDDLRIILNSLRVKISLKPPQRRSTCRPVWRLPEACPLGSASLSALLGSKPDRRQLADFQQMVGCELGGSCSKAILHHPKPHRQPESTKLHR